MSHRAAAGRTTLRLVNSSSRKDDELRLQLWGGVECTVNRVGNAFFDQAERSGHSRRLTDLNLFSMLGISALRCPLLWERTAQESSTLCNWSWSDKYLKHMQDFKITPIVGLVHHGSGPAYTGLLERDFATGLAKYARRAVERYPWITHWTPVNEPLTTARFSALYGHWYPHERSEAAFWLALVNQIDATRLSMHEIRAVNSAALLIATEDVGHTYATADLEGQARFDNLRRWMTWDLLCGRVVPSHPFWDRLVGFGLEERLHALADDPCPPDIIGINHYLTSDRFLDHRIERYPPNAVGENSYGRFADVEAARVVVPYDGGLETAMRETWDRYAIPIALTEVHNGCTREEQMRWMQEAWSSACRLRREAVDVRAVTAWSLLGSYDWDRLLTVNEGRYENGVFDLRGGSPRATAMVPLLQAIAKNGCFDHPVMKVPGWWRRDVRLQYPPERIAGIAKQKGSRTPKAVRPLLITGATGTLGRAMGAACDLRGIPYVLTGRSMLPLDEPVLIERLLEAVRPWAVINTAGWVRVDDAEGDPGACFRANRDGSINLARLCSDRQIPYTAFSSDLVFDGSSDRPYIESDPTAPLNVYGRSKAEADRELLSWGAPILIVRTAAFFSPHDPHNFAMRLVANLREGHRFTAAKDCWVSPTYVPDLVRASLDLVIDGEKGLWHLTNDGKASWADFGREIAKASGHDPAMVVAEPAEAMGWIATRPPMAALRSARAQMLPSLEDAIGRFATSLAA